MYSLQVNGSTLADCHKQILAMADEIRKVPGDVPVGTTSPNGVINFPTPAAPTQSPVDTSYPVSVGQGPAIDNGFDADQVRWDARIHAATKMKTQDGKWKRRRGVDDSIFDQVMNELKGTVVNQQPVALPAIPTTDVPAHLPAESTSVLAEIKQDVVVPNIPAPTPVPAAMPQGNVYTPQTFQQNIIQVLNKLAADGKVHAGYIDQLKQWFGKELHEFSSDTEKCKILFDTFVKDGFIQAV